MEYADVLVRTKNTTPQIRLLSADRKKNIKGAFDLNDRSRVSGKNVILIDDVWTTGSTLKECCNILKRGGTVASAKKVWAVTIAR